MRGEAAAENPRQPWVELYPKALSRRPHRQFPSITAAWAARVADAPESVAIRYFDGCLTTGELDRAANAVAVGMQELGLQPGDRVALCMQNIPYVVIVHLAVWKAGAISVPINPMYRHQELRRIIDDCRPRGFIAAGVDEEVLRSMLFGSSVGWMLSCSDRDFQTEDDPRVFTARSVTRYSQGDLGDFLTKPVDGQQFDTQPELEAPAFISYTSGTTGPPKGAMNSHGNFLRAADNFTAWAGVEPGDPVFAMAPLFHITGLSLNAGVALLGGGELVVAGRFHPEVAIEQISRHKVSFTIGSVTALNAMAAVEWAGPEHFGSLRNLYSGGAPIPPAALDLFRERFGSYVRNAWGMTETTGGGIAVPPDREAPVHADSGTLSVGLPMPSTQARVVDADGRELPFGEEGELEFSGPQVISGYWNNPTATAATFPCGALRTGDVAVMDSGGWVYLVDRLKDQINVSGFKVWPREVEDVLFSHPAVYEAAVVGEQDSYRGEVVVAYVSLMPDASIDPDDLISFTRERLASYKCPRSVRIVAHLPKTATGKIQRTAVRQQRPEGMDA